MKKRNFAIVCAILVLALSLCVFVACDDNKSDNSGQTPMIGFESGTGGTIKDDVLSLEVGTTVDKLDVTRVVTALNGATYSLCEDENGKFIVADKQAKLENGSNKFYIVATLGEQKKTYEFNIWKNFKTTIYFYVNDTLFDTKDDVLSHTYLEDFRAPEDLLYGIEFLEWGCKGHYLEEENKEFHAKLKYQKANITFDTDGADYDIKEKQVNVGAKFTLPVPQKDGYSFLGWTFDGTLITDKDGASKDGYIFVTPGNATLVAKWSANSVKVSFNSNMEDVCKSFVYYGKTNETATVTYTYGGSLQKLGYRFLGWFKNGEKVCDGFKLTFDVGKSESFYEMKWQYDVACDNLYYQIVDMSFKKSLVVTGVKDKSVTSIEIPYGVDMIAEGALSGCGNLQELIIPSLSMSGEQGQLGYIFGRTNFENSIRTTQDFAHSAGYGDYDWYLPLSLKKVTVLKGEYVGEGAFENCSMIEEIVLPSEIKEISKYAFSGCSSLKSINLGEKVTVVTQNAFANCVALKSVVLGGGVTAIHKNAFMGCASLDEINLPDTITFVGADAFTNTAWLAAQPQGVVYIGKVAYTYSGEPAESLIVLRDDTVYIAERAFKGINAYVYIPASVVKAGKNLFDGSILCAVFCESQVTPNGWDAEWKSGAEEIEVLYGQSLDEVLKQFED